MVKIDLEPLTIEEEKEIDEIVPEESITDPEYILREEKTFFDMVCDLHGEIRKYCDGIPLCEKLSADNLLKFIQSSQYQGLANQTDTF